MVRVSPFVLSTEFTVLYRVLDLTCRNSLQCFLHRDKGVLVGRIWGCNMMGDSIHVDSNMEPFVNPHSRV